MKLISVSYIDERRVVGSGEGGGGSEMGSTVLDRRYLSVLRSASGGFKDRTQLLSLLQKAVEC